MVEICEHTWPYSGPSTCHQSGCGGHGSSVRCWQFVTNNTKYLCNIAMLMIGIGKLLPDKYLDFVTVTVKP